MSDWKTQIRERLSEVALEPAREAEIVEELNQHFEQRFDELLSGGATHEEASRAVLAELRDTRFLARELHTLSAVPRPILSCLGYGESIWLRTYGAICVMVSDCSADGRGSR